MCTDYLKVGQTNVEDVINTAVPHNPDISDIEHTKCSLGNRKLGGQWDLKFSFKYTYLVTAQVPDSMYLTGECVMCVYMLRAFKALHMTTT